MPSMMIRHHQQRKKQQVPSFLTHVVFLTLLIAIVLPPCVMSVGATATVQVDTTTPATKKVAKVATKPKIPTTPKKVVHPFHPPKANVVAVPLFSVANPNTTPILQQQQGRADNYYKPPRADDYYKPVPTPTPMPVPTPRSPSRSKRSKSKKGKGKKSSKVIISKSKSMKKSKSYYDPSHKSSTLTPTRNPTQRPTLNPTRNPTRNPTLNPSLNPTLNPSFNPTLQPTPCVICPFGSLDTNCCPCDPDPRCPGSYPGDNNCCAREDCYEVCECTGSKGEKGGYYGSDDDCICYDICELVCCPAPPPQENCYEVCSIVDFEDCDIICEPCQFCPAGSFGGENQLNGGNSCCLLPPGPQPGPQPEPEPGPEPGPEPPTNAPTTTNPRITFPPTFFPTITFPPSSTFAPTTTFKPSVTPEPSSP